MSGLGCVCCNSKNSPCFGSSVLGLCGAGSCAAAWSQCGLKSLSVCLLHMWICSTDVSWLLGRQALLPLAFLAPVVTWWHTVASGVQTGSPRANTIQSSTSLALLRNDLEKEMFAFFSALLTCEGLLTTVLLNYILISMNNPRRCSLKIRGCGERWDRDVLTAVVRWGSFLFLFFISTGGKHQKHLILTSWNGPKGEEISCVLLIVQLLRANGPEKHQTFQSPYHHIDLMWCVRYCVRYWDNPKSNTLHEVISTAKIMRKAQTHISNPIIIEFYVLSWTKQRSTKPKLAESQKWIPSRGPLKPYVNPN